MYSLRCLWTLLLVLASLPVPARAANPDALWHIVSQQCVPASSAGRDPQPCTLVDQQRQFVILKDIVGVAQYLLIPTVRLSGIESSDLLLPDAPNYWAYAWEQRFRVQQALARPLADQHIGLEVNSAAARSQLQLHIHIDCLRADLPTLLKTYENVAPEVWLPFTLEGHQYQLMRLTGADLGARNPFKLAAAMSPFAATAMGAQSLLLTGARFSDGSSGFYLLAMAVNFNLGERGSAEVLLDHQCR